jgi:predicted transglutaminase-like protease
LQWFCLVNAIYCYRWQVYSLTKDPLSLGIIGLMEIIPAIVMALFAGHIVDQNEKKSFAAKMHFRLFSH